MFFLREMWHWYILQDRASITPCLQFALGVVHWSPRSTPFFFMIVRWRAIHGRFVSSTSTSFTWACGCRRSCCSGGGGALLLLHCSTDSSSQLNCEVDDRKQRITMTLRRHSRGWKYERNRIQLLHQHSHLHPLPNRKTLTRSLEQERLESDRTKTHPFTVCLDPSSSFSPFFSRVCSLLLRLTCWFSPCPRVHGFVFSG